MHIRKNVCVSKQNAKDVLKFVEYSDWRYKFIEAIANGKSVEHYSYSGGWMDFSKDGYMFDSLEHKYRIVESNKVIKSLNWIEYKDDCYTLYRAILGRYCFQIENNENEYRLSVKIYPLTDLFPDTFHNSVQTAKEFAERVFKDEIDVYLN